jgi:DNA repair exonuclease SbcCD ATPase subunit
MKEQSITDKQNAYSLKLLKLITEKHRIDTDIGKALQEGDLQKLVTLENNYSKLNKEIKEIEELKEKLEIKRCLEKTYELLKELETAENKEDEIRMTKIKIMRLEDYLYNK